MKDLTYIIPVFGLKDDKVAVDNVKKAIASIGKGKKIITVGSKDDLELVKGTEKVVNDGDLSYPSQVMTALNSVTTKYFTVIEQDDTVNEKWYDYVEEYLKTDDNEIFGYLPLTEVEDTETGEIIGYANEAFWASSFSEELGYLDSNCMEDYFNFNTSGGIFKTKEFLALGGLKTSMKLTFWYEFLLRVLYKEKKIYVIPRVGYFHKINRKGSLTDIYSSTMSEKEADWWIELAKKEFFFPQDRKKTYEEE